ncbi:hypothetical protein BDP27DRAFT_1368980 [Rhodocollybia butyracea]|uniref:DUF4100 domain-containing protein n=1 Tax=Rhodocollybia butyracea TaxID=206335 RepID=A0A9P5U1D5_9AGAR|nr:hypothetical protein BDP27DRAFT_1368980 [Rhodocollybia butyracea]
MSNPTSLPLVVPMPVAGTNDAPFFEGKDTERYLKKILQHGAKAGIRNNDELVDYILDYCNTEVYESIQYLPAFDPEVTTKTWALSSQRLIRLYRANNTPKDVSVEDLKQYCAAAYFNHPFECTADVDEYQMGFLKLSSALMKRGRLTETYANELFITGIPKHLTGWIITRVPEQNQTISNPPAIDIVVDLLYKRLGKDSIDWNPYDTTIRKHDSAMKKVHFDDSENSIRSRTDPVEDQRPQPQYIPDSKSTKDEVDHIANQLRDLRLSMAEQSQQTLIARRVDPPLNATSRSEIEQLNQQLREMQQTMAQLRQQTPLPGTNTGYGPATCFTCGKVHPDPFKPSRCPVMPELVSEGLVKFDSETKRYNLPDGNSLPRVPKGESGGIARILRAAKANSSMGGSRDVPPHAVGSTRHASFSYDGMPVFSGDAYAVSSLEESEEYFDNEEEFYQHVYDSRIFEANSFPQLRSGRNTDNRFDPHSQRGRPQHDRSTTNVPVPTVPRPPVVTPPTSTATPPVTQKRLPAQLPTPSTSKVEDIRPPEGDVTMADPPPPTPMKKAPTSVPKPPNPINREDGWKTSLPAKNPKTDSKPTEKALPPGQHFKFTSEIQEKGNTMDIAKKIWDTTVTVSVKDLISASLDLQRHFADMTRTKQKYVNTADSHKATYDLSSDRMYEYKERTHLVEDLEIIADRDDLEAISSYLV